MLFEVDFCEHDCFGYYKPGVVHVVRLCTEHLHHFGFLFKRSRKPNNQAFYRAISITLPLRPVLLNKAILMPGR